MAKKPYEKAADKRARLEAVRLKAAGKVFMEYHEDSAWAEHKLQSGTAPLTPESVRYMQDEIDLRKRRAKHEADIQAMLAAEKPAANPIGGTREKS